MTRERLYPITSLHKDDLRDLFRDPATGQVPEAMQRRIDALTHADMAHVAAKMADAFCTCCYWEALETIFMENFSAAGGLEAYTPAQRETRAAEEAA